LPFFSKLVFFFFFNFFSKKIKREKKMTDDNILPCYCASLRKFIPSSLLFSDHPKIIKLKDFNANEVKKAGVGQRLAGCGGGNGNGGEFGRRIRPVAVLPAPIINVVGEVPVGVAVPYAVPVPVGPDPYALGIGGYGINSGIGYAGYAGLAEFGGGFGY
jgi:hypothetical protein